jgi:predicted nucleotidyltransferase
LDYTPAGSGIALTDRLGINSDMVTDADIQALASRIAAEFRPRKIILFGSRAYGTPHEDSDVDLIVVMPFEGTRVNKEVEIVERVHPGTYPIDLLVRTQVEMSWRYKGGDPLIRDAVDHGVVLYEAAA